MRAQGAALLLLAGACNADALDVPVAGACPGQPVESPLAEETASAGIMYNLAEHPKSIRAVASRLLQEALDARTDAQTTACGDCMPSTQREIVYRVAPVRFLPEREQQAVCRGFEAETAQTPWAYPDQHFDSLEELNAWIMEFSQGRGEQGKRLYAQCSANCSPRYEFTIASASAGLEVATRVQCGLARDRASDDYRVSTALRTSCIGVGTPLASSSDSRPAR